MTEVVGLSILACYGVLVALGVLPTPVGTAQPILFRLRRESRARATTSVRRRQVRWLRTACVVAVALAVFRAPIVGVVVGFGAWHLDRLRGLWRRSLQPIERGDAIAMWAEMLADDIAAGRGVQQAVIRTAGRVRPAIRPAAESLMERLQVMTLPRALVGLDDALDHPCGDLLAGALVLAAAGETQDVSRPLRMVAARSRLLSEKLASADAKRGGARKAARTVLWAFGIVGPVPLIVLRSSMDWYASAEGQLFLSIIAIAVVWSLMRLRSLAQLRVPDRVLRSELLRAGS